jgi:hypothetical protein
VIEEERASQLADMVLAVQAAFDTEAHRSFGELMRMLTDG